MNHEWQLRRKWATDTVMRCVVCGALLDGAVYRRKGHYNWHCEEPPCGLKPAATPTVSKNVSRAAVAEVAAELRKKADEAYREGIEARNSGDQVGLTVNRARFAAYATAAERVEGGVEVSEQETSELRDRIEASLRTRYGTSRVAVEVQEHGVTQWRAVARLHGDALGDVVRSRVSDTDADALAALACAVGLNPDGTDPRTELETLRQRVDILNARDEVGIEERDRLRRERDEARAEIERAEPRRQRDARDIADADAEIARLRARADAAERERDSVLAATREFFAAEVAHDATVAAWLDTDEMNREADAAKDASAARLAAARSALAALVGGER